MASENTAGDTPADTPADTPVDTSDSVVINGTRYKTAKEGLARIYVPLSDGDKERQNGGGGPAVDDHPQQVFYNPIQQFNRDLSVLAIKAYGTSLVEKRVAAFARKKEQFASKKRKRQSAGGADRIAKAEKQAEGQDAATAATDEDGEATAKDAQSAAGEAATATAAATTEPAAANTAPPPPVRILDALSATGLRALRYAHELPFGVSVTANDLLAAATEAIRRNAALNGLQDKIAVTQADALGHMYGVVARDMATVFSRDGSSHKRSEKYDVIDLDPYGTAANFFDAAVQAVRSDGGLLCVTCTDAGVWASQGYPEKCFALYGGVPMKGAHSHEAGLRIVLHALAASAARYGLAITPQLSLSIDFYCRVFVTVARSPARVKLLAVKTMVAYNCDQGCGAWTTQPLLRTRSQPNKRGSGSFFKFTFATAPAAAPLCAYCGTKTHLAGPMYAGPLHQAAFVRRILDDLPAVSTDVYGTTDRIRGMLQTALEELVEPEPAADEEAATEPLSDAADAAVDPAPFFFLPTNLAKAMHCTTPGETGFRGALLRLGYRVTRSHCRAGSIKTDAPWAVLWDVMRAFVHQKAPVKRENIRPGTAAHRLLRIEEGGAETDKHEDTTTNAAGAVEAIVFDEVLGHQAGRRGGEKLVRYQLNPRENWGPMNRAKGH